MNSINFKAFGGSVKDIDPKKRVVTGYLTAFGNIDLGGDIGVQGMFAKSIQERKDKIFFLNQHDWKQPHGKFAVLQEDSNGLYFESEPLPNTTYSNDVLKLYEAEVIKEHSYGYSVVKSAWDDEAETRTLLEVKLYEGSNVTLGMNPNTPFTGFKELHTVDAIEKEQKAILNAIKSGTFTDETFTLLEVALKRLQQQAFELGKKSLDRSQPPANGTLIIDKPKQLLTIQEFIKQI